jgi:thioredoxin-like negative regulator of GroEL
MVHVVCPAARFGVCGIPARFAFKDGQAAAH